MIVRSLSRYLLVLALIAPAAAACARAHARTQPAPPPLDPPPPPPRVVVLQPEAPVSGPVPEPPTAPRPARPRPAQRPSDSADGGRAEPHKTEPPPPVEQAPPRPPAPAQEPGALQMTPPATQGQVERDIRERLAQASRDLARIDYRALNNEARAQYDTAKRFIEQAEQALKDKNLPFAQKLADKAEALAALLVPR